MKQVVRLVVDNNCLQSQELDNFLSVSRNNFAVLTDYACMEIYRARLDTAVHSKISILARFPRQVLMLKGTKAVCGLSGRQAGLTRRLVDAHQTRQFDSFCEAVEKFANGDERFREDINRKQALAREHLSKMASDLAGKPLDYAGFQALFTEAEIRGIRLREPLQRSTAKKFLKLIRFLAEALHRDHPTTKRQPSREEWPNTFLYRYSVFELVQFLDWIRRGSPSNLSVEKTRNTAVDMIVGTYATYFEGLLTKDQRCQEVFDEASFLLERIILPTHGVEWL